MNKTMKKTALIMGVANDRSLAYSIAEKFLSEGYEIGILVSQERFLRKLDSLRSNSNLRFVAVCDVTKDSDFVELEKIVKQTWQTLDAIVHSIAFAPTEALEGKLTDLTFEQFSVSAQVSVYSFIKFAGVFSSLLKPGSSLLTLSNIGAQRVIPHYHVMGIMKAALECAVRYLAYELGPQKIRVNAISAGPVKTLSAMAINDFGKYLKMSEERAPLRENIDGRDVAELARFLCGVESRHITGTIQYLDSGTHVLGV